DAGVPRFPWYVGVRDEVHIPPPTGGSIMETKTVQARRFEYVAGTSSKFWEVQVQGSEVVVRFGRIGSPGQTITKTFPDGAAAANYAEKLVREKVAKGYVERA